MVDPNYLWILYLRIYLLKFICNPKINTHGTFAVFHRHAQNGKNF